MSGTAATVQKTTGHEGPGQGPLSGTSGIEALEALLSERDGFAARAASGLNVLTATPDLAEAVKRNGVTVDTWDGRAPYYGKSFLGKVDEEKEIQISLITELMATSGFQTNEDLIVADFGSADGWAMRTMMDRGLLSANTKAFLFDASSDMMQYAVEASKDYSNITVEPDLLDLQASLRSLGGADVVFLNMVDLCQPSRENLKEMFRDVAACLRPGGHLIMTTQNPWARPGVFKHYRTDFKNPHKHHSGTLNAQLETHVNGVSTALIDYHRPVHVTLGTMLQERLTPGILITMGDDDAHTSQCCELAKLVAPTNGASPTDRIWVPQATKDLTDFVMMGLDPSSGQIADSDKAHIKVNLNPKAPYLAVSASNQLPFQKHQSRMQPHI